MAEEYDSKFEEIIKEIEGELEDGKEKSNNEPIKKPSSIKKEENEEIEEFEEESESGDGSKTEDSYYPHLDLILSEDIDEDLLSDDTRAMIQEFNALREEMESDKSLSDEAFLSLRNLSSVIEESILSDLSQDNEDSDDATEENEGDDIVENEEEMTSTEPKKDGNIFSDWLGGIFDW